MLTASIPSRPRGGAASLVVVRTTLQSVIVSRMMELGMVPTPIELVLVLAGPDDLTAEAMTQRLSPRDGDVCARQTLVRSTLGQFGLFWVLLSKLWASRIHGRRVYFSNLNWVAFALALRATPGLRFHSFDDGSANVMDHRWSYRSNLPSDRPGLSGWLLRRLFPRGCAAYSRQRIVRHCTIYPGLDNVVPPQLVDSILVAWADLIPLEHRSQLPVGVRRIFLGSVYSELRRFHGADIRDDDLDWLRSWADLYIAHPRASDPGSLSPPLSGYPAESYIAHYSSQGPVQVAHYNSSALLAFRQSASVTGYDLHDPGALAQLRVGGSALPQGDVA